MLRSEGRVVEIFNFILSFFGLFISNLDFQNLFCSMEGWVFLLLFLGRRIFAVLLYLSRKRRDLLALLT